MQCFTGRKTWSPPFEVAQGQLIGQRQTVSESSPAVVKRRISDTASHASHDSRRRIRRPRSVRSFLPNAHYTSSRAMQAAETNARLSRARESTWYRECGFGMTRLVATWDRCCASGKKQGEARHTRLALWTAERGTWGRCAIGKSGEQKHWLFLLLPV
jgi:hypothetical protein